MDRLYLSLDPQTSFVCVQLGKMLTSAMKNSKISQNSKSG